MPSYDFKCTSCDHVFEKFFSVHDEHRANCEKCLSTHTFRYMGNNSVAVHGFTTFADPRGGDGRLTLKEINAIEKRDNLVYGNHDDIRKEAKKNKLDPTVLAAMLHVESNWKPHVVSYAGACGIAQVMPQWSKYTCDQLKNPKIGLPEGARKLNYWVYKYGKGNLSVGPCGYNAGFRCKGKKPNRAGVLYDKKVLKVAKKLKRKIK